MLHGSSVSDGVISLLKKGPTFSPTPLDPPDISVLEKDISDWKQRIRWAYLFRVKRLKEDPSADLSLCTPFCKPPWYSRTDKMAPIASDEVELFMELVSKTLLSPSNFLKFSSNISPEESSAFKELRVLKQNGFSVFLQDKSSRFVIAKQNIIAGKVDEDIADTTRYTTMEEDDTDKILLQIKSWWRKHNSKLSAVDMDISDWLLNTKSKPGKMKVLIKTHKQNLPVREVFSVCNQPVENLSALLQYCYLGPIVNSGILKWRLRDTKELIQFLHQVNDYIKINKITTPPSLCCVDIKNMFPSIFKSLALPAVKKQLLQRGYSAAEVKAVIDALEIVRDGTRVQWREETIQQVKGCSLGPADSCDYSDIALDSFLQILVPRLEHSLDIDLRFLRFFRDDGVLIFFGESQLVLDMLEILNQERQELQFTTEYCPCDNVLGSCSVCPKSLPYLDCMISVYMDKMEDGTLLPQLKTSTYSKPTDVHHYIDPSSCTPMLSRKSPAIIKGVAHRLRVTNMLDVDLLQSLDVYSGYLVASGFDKASVIRQFTDILSVSNRELVFKTKEPDHSFKIALVTKMHPALPNINKIFDKFYSVVNSCPVSSKVFPRSSLISTNRKLPSLSSILANSPFSVPNTPRLPRGFYRTPGCSCKICKEAKFTSIIFTPTLPGRGISIPNPICCQAINVVYVIICSCGLPYVGRTGLPKPRWANHKSHIRNQHHTCNLATHCSTTHREEMVGPGKIVSVEDIKSRLTFVLLESIGEDGSQAELKVLENKWRDRLQSWHPLGLNTRDD